MRRPVPCWALPVVLRSLHISPLEGRVLPTFPVSSVPETQQRQTYGEDTSLRIYGFPGVLTLLLISVPVVALHPQCNLRQPHPRHAQEHPFPGGCTRSILGRQCFQQGPAPLRPQPQRDTDGGILPASRDHRGWNALLPGPVLPRVISDTDLLGSTAVPGGTAGPHPPRSKESRSPGPPLQPQNTFPRVWGHSALPLPGRLRQPEN